MLSLFIHKIVLYIKLYIWAKAWWPRLTLRVILFHIVFIKLLIGIVHRKLSQCCEYFRRIYNHEKIENLTNTLQLKLKMIQGAREAINKQVFKPNVCIKWRHKIKICSICFGNFLDTIDTMNIYCWDSTHDHECVEANVKQIETNENKKKT